MPTVTLPEVRERTKLLPPFNVIIENDDHHSQEFVMYALQKTFGYNDEKCYELMMTAHSQGEAVVWTGSKEVAELKAEQLTTLHEIRARDNKDLGPLGVRVEPTE